MKKKYESMIITRLDETNIIKMFRLLRKQYPKNTDFYLIARDGIYQMGIDLAVPGDNRIHKYGEKR